MATRVFISHRHADKPIARAIRENLQDWGIPREAIFQSSDAASGPMIGEALEQALREALCDAKLVILAYTFADQDWSYCMWECGVATGAAGGDARIAVFQCTDDTPELFKAQVRTRINPDEVHRFTEQLHKEPGFLRGEPAFDKDVDLETIGRKATRLYEGLRSVSPEKKRKEVRRWDSLTLALDPQFVTEVQEITEGEGSGERAADLLRCNLVVVGGFGEAAKHFGFDRLESNKPFADYVERWRQATSAMRLDAPEEWIQGFCHEVRRAIRNRSSEPRWEQLRSARRDANWWFYPVLNHARELPDNSMEFDLYLFRVPGRGTP